MRLDDRTLVVFDVDGTLLLSGKVSLKNYCRAFADVSGVIPSLDNILFPGMTDRGIFRAMLEANGVDADFEALFSAFARSFTRRITEVYEDAEGPHLLSGVRELVLEMAVDDRIILALGTGNIRETAYLKLKRFGLDKYFPVGGFGGDYEQREDVIRAAVVEAGRFYGWSGQAWVIGDTAKDVEAAHAVGARAIAVASGIVDKSELLATDAEVILDDLSDTDKVIEIVTADCN